MEEVYRVEVFVHHFRPAAEVPHGRPTLTFRLWQFPPLTIMPENFPSAHADPQLVQFDCGKSCLFQMPRTQFESLLPMSVHFTLACSAADEMREVGRLVACVGRPAPSGLYCSLVGVAHPLLDVGGAPAGDLLFDLKLTHVSAPGPAPPPSPSATQRLEALVEELRQQVVRLGDGREARRDALPAQRSAAVQCDGADTALRSPAGPWPAAEAPEIPVAPPITQTLSSATCFWAIPSKGSSAGPPATTSPPAHTAPAERREGLAHPRRTPLVVAVPGDCPRPPPGDPDAVTDPDGWSIVSSTPSTSSEPDASNYSPSSKTPLVTPVSSSGPPSGPEPRHRPPSQCGGAEDDIEAEPRQPPATATPRPPHRIPPLPSREETAPDPGLDGADPPHILTPGWGLSQHLQEEVIAQLLPVVDVAYSLAQRWPDILPAALPDHVQRLLELHAGLVRRLVRCTNQLWYLLGTPEAGRGGHVMFKVDGDASRFSTLYEPLLLPAARRPTNPSAAPPGLQEWVRWAQDHAAAPDPGSDPAPLPDSPPLAAATPTAAGQPPVQRPVSPPDRPGGRDPPTIPGFPPPPLLALADDSSTISEPSPPVRSSVPSVEAIRQRPVLLRSQMSPVLPQNPSPEVSRQSSSSNRSFNSHSGEADLRGAGAPAGHHMALPPTDLHRRKRSSILQRLQSPSRVEGSGDAASHVSPSEKWFGSTKASIELDVPARWLGEGGKLTAGSPAGSATSSTRTPTVRTAGRRVSKPQIITGSRGAPPTPTRARAKQLAGTPPARSPPAASPPFSHFPSAAPAPTSTTISASSREEEGDAAPPAALLAFQQSMAALLSQMS
eukprot:EG_transcript_2837